MAIIQRKVALPFRGLSHIRRRRAELYSLLQQLPVPIHATDSTGKIVFWSKGCEKLTGHTFQKLASMAVEETLAVLFPGEELQRKIVKEWMSHRSKKRPFRDWQWDITCRDGKERTISWTSLTGARFWSWTRPELYWCVGTDVTAQKKAHSLLQLVVSGFATTSADQFFERLVLHLTATTGLEHALIGELCPDCPTQVSTVAFCYDNKIVPNIEYCLCKTPCEDAVRHVGVAKYPTGIQQLYPEDQQAVDLDIDSYLGISLHSTKGKE